MSKLKSFMIALGLVAATVAGSHLQAQEPIDQPTLPLSKTPSIGYVSPPPLSFAQQVARYEAEQRVLRIEFNKWIGHSPLRPATNADLFMGYNQRRYYLPSRGIIVGNHVATAWYW